MVAIDRDAIPPLHGEPGARDTGRGSNVYTAEEWDALDPGCCFCGGNLVPLGGLGVRTWARCRDCGLDQSMILPYNPAVEEEF